MLPTLLKYKKALTGMSEKGLLPVGMFLMKYIFHPLEETFFSFFRSWDEIFA